MRSYATETLYRLPSGIFLRKLTTSTKEYHYIKVKTIHGDMAGYGPAYESHRISEEEWDALYPLSKEVNDSEVVE